MTDSDIDEKTAEAVLQGHVELPVGPARDLPIFRDDVQFYAQGHVSRVSLREGYSDPDAVVSQVTIDITKVSQITHRDDPAFWFNLEPEALTEAQTAEAVVEAQWTERQKARGALFVGMLLGSLGGSGLTVAAAWVYVWVTR